MAGFTSKAQLKFWYQDQLTRNYTENLGVISQNMLDEKLNSSDTAVKRAFLEGVDSGCRAISTLTTNTYGDAEIIREYSVNEELEKLDGE